jgi:PAS domain S-box-containing protein
VSLADQQIEAAPGELQALEDAFAYFSRHTAQLKDAYLRLRSETERINLQLEQANRDLEAKVRELDQATNFQHSILESIPTAVVVTDLDGVINTFNAAAERLWGITGKDALGRDFRQVMGGHSDLLAAVLAGGGRQEHTRRELGQDDARIISSTAALVEDSSGRPIGAVRIDRDITEVCALETRLNHRERLADLGKVAAGLVHEIRKPLNGIKGFASLLERKMGQDDTHRRYISSIMGAADRLNAMLGRLLGFARPEALRLAPCDLRAEAEEIAAFVRAEAPNGPAVIGIQVPDEARTAMADTNKIKQVLLNLVKNAVEALDDGGGCVCIRTRLVRGDKQVIRLEVEDDGTGIAEEDLRKITEPFYTAKPGGTGLGLSIVSRILQLHGTQLDIESRTGRGTTMGFSLPTGPAAEVP